ncbi:MAG: SWIM zinc finger family protein [Cyanobacteria bacterium P01_D01_bin.50]
MSAIWTQEQIVALAPDASSAENRKVFATSGKWSSLGYNEKAVWGEAQGSGKNPYQTQIDLSEPAFKCSCPSQKIPCKHGIDLFLLSVNEQKLFTQKIPPSSVSDWLKTRSQRKAKNKEKVNSEPKFRYTSQTCSQAFKQSNCGNAGFRGMDAGFSQ